MSQLSTSGHRVLYIDETHTVTTMVRGDSFSDSSVVVGKFGSLVVVGMPLLLEASGLGGLLLGVIFPFSVDVIREESGFAVSFCCNIFEGLPVSVGPVMGSLISGA